MDHGFLETPSPAPRRSAGTKGREQPRMARPTHGWNSFRRGSALSSVGFSSEKMPFMDVGEING